jgi:hypothetical protein
VQVQENCYLSGPGWVRAREIDIHQGGYLYVYPGPLRWLPSGNFPPPSRRLHPLAVTVTNEPTATMMMFGDYNQDAGSTLVVQVNGPVPLVDYGVLEVHGNMKIAGKLVFNFAGGFAPRQGQAFKVLSATNTVAGKFDAVEVAGLAPGFQYEIRNADPRSLSLVALNDGIPASAPELSILRTGNQAEISWPAFVQGFKLQGSPNLLPGSWTDRSTSNNKFSIPLGQRSETFRLVKP